MEVSMPIFVIGIKDSFDNKNCSSDAIVKKHIAIEILLNMLIGKSSELYKDLYEKELITGEPYLEYEFSIWAVLELIEKVLTILLLEEYFFIIL